MRDDAARSFSLRAQHTQDRRALAMLGIVARLEYRTPTNMGRILLEAATEQVLRARGVTDEEIRQEVTRLAQPVKPRKRLARRGRRAPKDGDAQGGASKVDQAAGAA